MIIHSFVFWKITLKCRLCIKDDTTGFKYLNLWIALCFSTIKTTELS